MGVYMQPSGTTMRVASMREVGQMFHEKRTPLLSSTSRNTSIADAAIAPFTSTGAHQVDLKRNGARHWTPRHAAHTATWQRLGLVAPVRILHSCCTARVLPMAAQAAPAERDEFGLPRPPISKTLGEPVIVLEHVQKRASRCRWMLSDLAADYSIAGRKEVVRALEDICLAPNSELYPIRRYA